MSTLSRIDTVFELIPRHMFIPDITRELAEQDRPFSIGFGQTNSQPSTVRRMLEWLDVQPDQRVLDVGSGSGWTSALLAELVGMDGHVTAVERVPELVLRSRMALQRLGLHHIVVHEAEKQFGWPPNSPYDRILVSAAAESLPDELIEQLASPGKMVIPIGQTIHEISKDNHGKLTDIEHPGFIFVPLILRS